MVTRSCQASITNGHQDEILLTPHWEKQRMWRPSGAHSALRRPSAPASIRAFHVSSLSLNTSTTPFFADAASRYSESHDQPAWDIQPSAVAPELDEVDFDLDEMLVVLEGAAIIQVRVICRVSVRLTIKVFSTTLKMK